MSCDPCEKSAFGGGASGGAGGGSSWADPQPAPEPAPCPECGAKPSAAHWIVVALIAGTLGYMWGEKSG